jgi:RHS repeat-associated protein
VTKSGHNLVSAGMPVSCRAADRRCARVRFRNRCRDQFPLHVLVAKPFRKNRRTCFEAPFGEVIRATGPMAKANPLRFSTKYQDDETDLLYYGYRYYSASTGRWANRDPQEELGGPNLYAFVHNTPTIRIDILGRTDWDWIPIIGTWIASHYTPKGSNVSDYSYGKRVRDEVDVLFCERAIDSQFRRYTVSANTPSAIGVAIDYLAVFISAGKGIPATIVAAVLAVDGTLKAAIVISNNQKISNAAEAAKATLCKCETE